MSQIFKIMLIGDVSTGKTSFLTQLIYQNPDKMPKPTVQWSFFTVKISSPATVIQIWDTPGDQRFYYKAISVLDKFKAVLIFIDVTNEHTLNRAKSIIDQLKVYPSIVIHLVLSKVDIVQKSPYKRKVDQQQANRISKILDGLVFEYSQRQKIQQILEKVVLHAKSNTQGNVNANRKQNKIFDNNKKSNTKLANPKPANPDNQFCECQIM